MLDGTSALVGGGASGLGEATAAPLTAAGPVGRLRICVICAGVAGLTLPAARDLAPWGIRVVSVAPGVFETSLLADMPARYRARLREQIPFPPRRGEPQEFAHLIMAVVANHYVNGATIRVDGGCGRPHGDGPISFGQWGPIGATCAI